jgi:hypothetical protein
MPGKSQDVREERVETVIIATKVFVVVVVVVEDSFADDEKCVTRVKLTFIASLSNLTTLTYTHTHLRLLGVLTTTQYSFFIYFGGFEGVWVRFLCCGIPFSLF